jgi:hypothetical protein
VKREARFARSARRAQDGKTFLYWAALFASTTYASRASRFHAISSLACARDPELVEWATNRHESCGRTAECFAEVRGRFIIQSRFVEGFVAGFCQLVQTPKLIQQASALDLADADDLIQL